MDLTWLTKISFLSLSLRLPEPPRLSTHDPVISWKGGAVLKWSPSCITSCLKPMLSSCCFTKLYNSFENNIPLNTINGVWSSAKPKLQNFHHTSSTCCQVLFHPKVVYIPVALPETKAMEEYVEEALLQGFIRPSTSPAAAGFFFVEKKHGTLWPCIDYRVLNAITVKFAYPLPLVTSVLEQMQEAQIFTKLNLHSAYNLIRAHVGDKWKMAFITNTGHYEYLVILFGLSNAPVVFQSFMKEIFKDMIKFIVVYVDNILIYSPSLETHVSFTCPQSHFWVMF